MKRDKNLMIAVWELTNKCNMYCKHCYKDFDTNGYPELSIERASELANEIVELKPYIVSLSGGEAILYKGWHIIAEYLVKKNINTNILTNGWDFSEKEIIKAKNAGIKNIGISLDGLKETHDFMRRQGSFDRIMATIDNIHRHGLGVSIATTVNNKNLSELPKIYYLLLGKKVNSWLLQAAMPLGNFRNHSSLAISPGQINTIIDFAYDVFVEKKIRIDLSDCLGYYNRKETEIRSANIPIGYDVKTLVNGCKAGVHSVGIMANGNVTGCISLQDEGYIEGNIHKRKLMDIWEDSRSFSWNLGLKKENLKGFCNKCQFGSYCLSGCPATSRKQNDINQLTENKYCSYNEMANSELQKIHTITSIKELKQKANEAFENNDFQLAELYYSYLNEKQPGKEDIVAKLKVLSKKLDNEHLLKAPIVDMK